MSDIASTQAVIMEVKYTHMNKIGKFQRQLQKLI